MNRTLKRFLIAILVLVLFLVLVTVLATTLFQKQVGRMLLSEINKSLTTELSVGEFHLTLFRSFPNLSADLEGVLLPDRQGGALLEAERMSFVFDLRSLFSSTYKVKSVSVSNGALQVRINKRGGTNYDIFREQPQTPQEETKINLSLTKARLRDIELIYANEETGQYSLAEVEEAQFSGEFSSKQFTLESEAELLSGFLETGGIRYLVGKTIRYDAAVQVNLEEGIYRMNQVDIEVAKNTFSLSGSVEQWKDATFFDLLLKSADGNLNGVLQLLPAEYQESLGDFSSSGDFRFESRVKGKMTARESPAIQAELELRNGRLQSPRLSDDLREVSFSASFTNGAQQNNRSSVLTIQDLQGRFNGQSLGLQLRVENLDDPFVDFQLNGAIPIPSVYRFLADALDDPRIRDGFGEVKIRNLLLRGRYEDMISPQRISQVEASGEIDFDDTGIFVEDKKVLIDSGLLQIQGNQLILHNLVLEGADSKLVLNGTASNVLPVLFADSANTEESRLLFTAGLEAEKLDIDQLLSLSPYVLEEEEKEKALEALVDSLAVREIESRVEITRFLSGTFQARISQFNYGDIEGANFIGNLEFGENVMFIEGRSDAMSGEVELEGRVFFEKEPHLEARIIGKSLDIKEFFRQSHNFGQEVLTQEHLSGALNTQMIIEAYWDSLGNFRMDDLRVLAGLNIREGELRNFQLLESFSSFVKIRDLRHIRFSNLENVLEVSRQTLFLPVMFIQSNALNLSINGEHRFDNSFRYNIQVNAGQVLMDRFRRYDPNLRPKAARKRGFFNLFYTVFGTIEKYEVEGAKRQVKADFERSLRRKQQIQETLDQAFRGSGLLRREDRSWETEPEADFLDFEVEGR